MVSYLLDTNVFNRLVDHEIPANTLPGPALIRHA